VFFPPRIQAFPQFPDRLDSDYQAAGRSRQNHLERMYADVGAAIKSHHSGLKDVAVERGEVWLEMKPRATVPSVITPIRPYVITSDPANEKTSFRPENSALASSARCPC
jgi:hypothetical protein